MKGFTLIESMVALSIIMVAITVPLYNASKGLTAAKSVNYQLGASYLAQEGIEFVRMMRDNEYLIALKAGGADVSGDAWRAFLQEPPGGSPRGKNTVSACLGGNVCALDTADAFVSPLRQCLAPDCSDYPLYTVPLNGRYTLSADANNLSRYTRSIQVTSIVGAAAEVRVTSTVRWTFHGQPFTVVINTHLTGWQ